MKVQLQARSDARSQKRVQAKLQELEQRKLDLAKRGREKKLAIRYHKVSAAILRTSEHLTARTFSL